jgi:hypothetical protein
MDYRTLIGEIMAPAIRRYKEREARRAADEHALSKAMLEKPSGEKPSHEDKPAGGNAPAGRKTGTAARRVVPDRRARQDQPWLQSVAAVLALVEAVTVIDALRIAIAALLARLDLVVAAVARLGEAGENIVGGRLLGQGHQLLAGAGGLLRHWGHPGRSRVTRVGRTEGKGHRDHEQRALHFQLLLESGWIDDNCHLHAIQYAACKELHLHRD